MDKLFHSTFDFFSHALPGFCIILAFHILDPELKTTNDFFNKANETGLGGAIFFAVLGYVIGFAIYPLGRGLYRHFKEKYECKDTDPKDEKVLDKKSRKDYKKPTQRCYDVAYKKNDAQTEDLFISDKYILVREMSPNNFKYIEIWNMFCAMAHNLAIACLTVSLCCLLKVIVFGIETGTLWSWILISIFSFLGAIILVHRAIIFSIWAANDLNAAIVNLKLKERASKLDQRQSAETHQQKPLS